jgi:signal transduction histidine kinase
VRAPAASRELAAAFAAELPGPAMTVEGCGGAANLRLMSLLATLSRSRLRAAFRGLSLLAVLVMLLVIALAMQNDVIDYPDLTALESVQRLASVLPLYCMIYLLPLPLVIAALNLAPATGWRRIAWLAGVALSYGLIAAAVGAQTDSIPENLVFAVSITAVYEFRSRASRSADKLLREQIDGSALEAELTRAQLQALRAQIEPHFLFNTLANVRRMAQDDPHGAAEMIGNLIRYFEAALPRLRAGESTLAEEQTLIDAYLRIHKIRMGARLSYDICIPTSLEQERVPSMMLLTLVENAIKHGLNPLTQGGRIEVSARRTGSTLELSVADSGRGMVAQAGTGTGLANIRARLKLLYGGAAHLALAHQMPHGVAVTIALPSGAQP